MRTVRIWFTKTGSARYISHLDLMRFFTRSFRKTDIRPWYTEGFNPRLHMVFTLSLPLGVEGLSEAFDVRIISEESNEELLKKLSAVSSEGLCFTGVTEPINVPSDVAFARYAVVYPNAPIGLSEHLNAAVCQGTLPAVKKNKKGVERQIALEKELSDFSITGNDKKVCLSFVLPASSENNISPLLFLSALSEKSEIDFSGCQIIREKLLLSDKSDFA